MKEPPQGRLRALLTAGALMICAGAARAQDPNYSFISTFGTGGFSVGGVESTALQVPVGFDLRSLEEHHWGLGLRVPVTFGVAELTDEQDLGDLKLSSLIAVPTIEARLRIRPGVLVKPFIGFGGGYVFQVDEPVWLGTLGVRAETVRPWGPFELGLSTTARFDFELDSGAGQGLSAGSIELKSDWRIASDLVMKSHELQPGFYVRPIFYFDPLRFDLLNGETETVQYQLELGISLGSKPVGKVLGVTIPRLFIGYRFGDGLQGLRISLDSI